MVPYPTSEQIRITTDTLTALSEHIIFNGDPLSVLARETLYAANQLISKKLDLINGLHTPSLEPKPKPKSEPEPEHLVYIRETLLTAGELAPPGSNARATLFSAFEYTKESPEWFSETGNRDLSEIFMQASEKVMELDGELAAYYTLHEVVNIMTTFPEWFPRQTAEKQKVFDQPPRTATTIKAEEGNVLMFTPDPVADIADATKRIWGRLDDLDETLIRIADATERIATTQEATPQTLNPPHYSDENQHTRLQLLEQRLAMLENQTQSGNLNISDELEAAYQQGKKDGIAEERTDVMQYLRTPGREHRASVSDCATNIQHEDHKNVKNDSKGKR